VVGRKVVGAKVSVGAGVAGTVGSAVVGVPVGPLVGLTVGELLGSLEGTPVGPLVGPTVGELVGPPVGPTVGELVGPPVGAIVGDSLGEALIEVGALVAPSPFLEDLEPLEPLESLGALDFGVLVVRGRVTTGATVAVTPGNTVAVTPGNTVAVTPGNTVAESESLPTSPALVLFPLLPDLPPLGAFNRRTVAPSGKELESMREAFAVAANKASARAVDLYIILKVLIYFVGC